MEKKQSPWLTLFLVVAVTAGVVLIFVQFRAFGAMQNALAEEEELLISGEAQLAALIRLHEQKEQFDIDLELLQQLLPEAAQEDQLLLDMQAGADLAGMELKQIRFGDRLSEAGYTEMPLQLQLTGTYHELLFFLDYLQLYERAVRIDELRVDANEEDADVTIHLGLSTFYVGEAEEDE